MAPVHFSRTTDAALEGAPAMMVGAVLGATVYWVGGQLGLWAWQAVSTQTRLWASSNCQPEELLWIHTLQLLALGFCPNKGRRFGSANEHFTVKNSQSCCFSFVIINYTNLHEIVD